MSTDAAPLERQPRWPAAKDLQKGQALLDLRLHFLPPKIAARPRTTHREQLEEREGADGPAPPQHCCGQLHVEDAAAHAAHELRAAGAADAMDFRAAGTAPASPPPSHRRRRAVKIALAAQQTSLGLRVWQGPQADHLKPEARRRARSSPSGLAPTFERPAGDLESSALRPPAAPPRSLRSKCRRYTRYYFIK